MWSTKLRLAPLAVSRQMNALTQVEAAHVTKAWSYSGRPDLIDEWWTQWPNANIGIVTGQVSSVIVLDADGDVGIGSLKRLETPATTWLSRTARGYHQWFAWPGIPVGNRAGLLQHLDVRGDGGYVVAPPSVHASGHRYAWLTPPERMPLAAVPEHVLALLVAAPTSGGSATAAPMADTLIEEGVRNDRLYRLGRSLVLKRLSREAILAALSEENGARCRPPLSSDEVRAIADHVMKQPHELGFRILTQEPSVDVVPWPAPESLPGGLLPVPAFDPRRMLQRALAPWVIDIAERAQCPPDFVAVATVVSAATVIGRKISIRPKRADDWTVVPNLWGLVVGRPGIMKTPALQEALKPLYRRVAEARLVYQQKMAEHEFRLAEERARHDALKKRLREAVENGDPTDDLRHAFEVPAYSAPTMRRYVVNDSTVEKLGELLNANPNGLLLFRDELNGFLQTMDRQGHENDRAFYCEAWNGNGSYTYDRIGRGTLHIEAACVSVLGSIQPGPLQGYLLEVFGGGGDDGLIQRFQMAVYPDTAREWRNVDRWPDSEAKMRAFDLFLRLDGLDPMEIAAHEPSPEELPFLRFTPEAQEVFDMWRATLEGKLRSEDEHPVLVSHLAKYRSLMPSLALTFHLVDCVDTGTGGPVSFDAAVRAAAWCDYLEAHAHRIYQTVTAGRRFIAGLLAAKLRAGKVGSPFRARDVYRNEWAGLTDPETVTPALELLEDLHWLRREDVRPPAGGRPTVRYHVNPKIMGMLR